MSFYEGRRAFIAVLVLNCLSCCYSNDIESETLEPSLKRFIGTLEIYQEKAIDVVFLLDESGSIGSDVFPHALLFTELTARIISISSTGNRAAVVTFSSGHIERFNYIQNSVNKNMCTFVRDVWNIDYKGGGTNTAEALREAEQLLRRGRTNSEKVIILISDGQSNNPEETLKAAIALKQSNHIIFAVGVADVNEKELLTVATGKEYIYILKDFAYIQKINGDLKTDTNEIEWDSISNHSLCNSFCPEGKDCCDSNAACFCGTKGGKYECACNPGYTGQGHKKSCLPCSRGTYSSKSTKKECTPCPENSTTQYEGSTGMKDCFCLSGYEGDPANNVPCRAVECAKLLSPEGGTVLPDQCGNTFDSTCTFKCHEGYCPYACNNTKSTNKSPWMILPKEPRKCLETKQWSGVEFFCEKIKCPSLNYPKDGIHNCSGSDFGFGTVCHMMCNTGFILHGSETRHCKVSGEWNGETTVCKAVTCPPLKENKVLIVKPKACHTVESVFDTTCQYLCKRGYKLVATHNSSEGESIGIRKCRSDGTWSRMVEMITCKDSSPPVLQCPQDIKAHTDKHKPTALVEWQLPNATDNVEVIEQKILYPPKVQKPPHSFNIGITTVTYIAVDRSGLNTTCSFQVTVIDSESPRVEYCPTNITKLYGKNDGLIVNWTEPVFIDNSGKVKIVKTRNSGDRFYWNSAALITYGATDPSGNDATCNFYVTVKQYQCQYAPPPLNGAVACETWLEGSLCTPYCEEEYDFVAEPENTYMCFQQTDSAKWGRLPGPGKKKEFKFPWPDCGKKVRPKRYTMKTRLRYFSGECPSKEAIQQMQENFVKRLDEYQYIAGLCPKKTCTPENVVVKCGKQTVNGIDHIVASRRKRTAGNISDKRLVPQSEISYMSETNKSELDEEKYRKKRFKRDKENSFIIEIAWDIQMSRNETEFSESCKECDDLSEESIAEKMRELQLLAMPELQTYESNLSSADGNISFVLIPECNIGQVARNMSCVNCPFGTYYNENLSECVACPVGQFQDNEASSFCKKCPSGSSTVNERSKSVEDCRKFCSPGSYSETGMETCQACPVGTYQHLPAQKDCNKCDEGTTTWTTGSSSFADCTTMCPPGTYSDTGFHPCTPCPHGTYQPLTQETECTACPSGLTTRIEGAHASEYCRVVDFCKDHMPCMHGGTCMNIGNSYSCSCVEGFEGRNCEINIDDCSDGLCLNNATCIDEINSYYCACLDGFTGQICGININDCNSESCLNGGTCIDGINKFVCKCPNGFTGDMCEINFYDCASDPCQNGGTCFDQVGSFRCCCPKGYTGKMCEQEIRECDFIDCYNGGTCIDKLGGFQCNCSDGFEGEYCEKNIDDCQVNDCKNNGICVDGISNYTCQCPSTFTGHYCETELSTKFGLKFPDVVTSNYVKLQNKKSLSAVTVSFWMRTDYVDKSNRGTPISYSFFNPITRKEVDNGLTLLDVNKFVFYLHGKEFHTNIIANSDKNWHHCAITWESLSGNWLLYWDGAVRSRGSGVAIGGRLWKGYFVIGQEQDGIGLAFSTLESYKGEISQFNVWDHVLPSRSIEELRSKCGLIGNVIAWTDVQANIYGSVTTIKNTDLCLGMEECTEKDCYCVSSAKPGNENCWRTIPSCEPNPCTVGQQCITKYNGVSECNCKSGFEGVFCQYDVDECITNNGNCSHFCVNTHGSYHCSCPFGMRLAADKSKCIDISFCEDNGLVYLNGEAWTKKCEKCTCIEGEINCTRLPCQKLECKENENEIFFPGECCSSCFGGYSSCILHHEKFHTFDNLEYSFSGNCRYSLMDDCFDGQFSVQYEDVKPKSKEKTVYIYVHCLEIYIKMPGIVFVNDEKVDTPYISSSLAHVIPASEKNVTALFIYTTHGIIIKWESPGRIEINVPQKYKKKICGLCGNFNKNKTDDYQTKQHLPARTVKDMALSWKVDGYKHCRNVTKKVPNNPIRITHYNTCKTSPYYMQQKARKQCSLLKQRVFRPCYKHINPLPYYKLCLQDSCSCLYNEQCYCDSIMSYIAECKRNKINIKSQKIIAHCEMECTGGTVYDECGPACVETCKTDLTAPFCHNELCVPGCHCPAGMALYNGRCIYKYQCPK